MRIIFQFLLIALFWFSGFAPAAATPQKPVDLHKEGIDIHHDSAIEHYKRGVAFADSGRYQKAVSEFKEVLKISPQGPKGHIILGLAYGKLGRMKMRYPYIKRHYGPTRKTLMYTTF